MAYGICTDVYVLVKIRSVDIILAFLNKFLPGYKETADEYEIPQYSNNPKIIFTKDSELMKYCAENINEVHTIYWGNKENMDPQNAMVFYTNDAHIILGLAIEDDDYALELLDKMKMFLKSDIGCIMVETPPPQNSMEFRNVCID